MSRRKSKAKGSFFADKETLPYTAKGVLRGQAIAESCVPAVCRMLIFDRFPELEDDIHFSESYLRHFLNTDATGSDVSDIPAVLRLAGMAGYEYHDDLTFDELREAVARDFAVVNVRREKAGWHVLIVEEITDEHVAIRDSLPDNTGSSYLIGWEDFQSVWLRPKNQRGIGVIMVK